MKHKNIFLFFLVGIVVFNSCKEEEKAEFVTVHYTLSTGLVEDYVSDRNRCTFVGYTLCDGDTLNYYRHISTCGATIGIEINEEYSSNNRKMHFEGNLDNGLQMFIDGGDNYPAPEFIWGKVDLLHSDEEYIEGTFSGAFFREYIYASDDHTVLDFVKDTIWLEDGYFKISVTDVFNKTCGY